MRLCRFVKALSTCAVLACPVALAQTYDFTGSVTAVNDEEDYPVPPGLTIGTPVSGSITINFDAAGAVTTGTLGSSSGWSVMATGGAGFGGSPLPPVPGQVFTEAVQVGSPGLLAYSTLRPSNNETSSTIAAGASFLYEGKTYNGEWAASEFVIPTSGTAENSSLTLNASVNPTFASDGTPIFPGSGSGLIYIATPSDGAIGVQYSITSLTPVPLPPACVLLLTGLVAMTLMARKAIAGFTIAETTSTNQGVRRICSH